MTSGMASRSEDKNQGNAANQSVRKYLLQIRTTQELRRWALQIRVNTNPKIGKLEPFQSCHEFVISMNFSS